MTTIRLLSYNIRALRDDNEALYRVIRSIAPDVVCIQEAPRFLRWRSRCAEIARRSGLVMVTGGRASGANLILSTLAVDVVATRQVGFSRDRGLHSRGIAVAVLRRGEATFAVAGTHLDLVDGPRLRHVGELHSVLDSFVPPGVASVVAGDMNCRPGSPVWSALAARGTDAHVAAGTGDGFTFRSTAPFERIDGVFAEAPIRVVSAQVIASPDTPLATDHCPLLVELEVPSEPPAEPSERAAEQSERAAEHSYRAAEHSGRAAEHSDRAGATEALGAHDAHGGQPALQG